MVDNIAGKSAPPFSVRNAQAINKDLGKDALPNEFTAIPLYGYMNASPFDDVSYTGCNYVEEAHHIRGGDSNTFKDYDYLMNDVRAPTATALNLTQEEADSADFNKMYDYTDVVTCL